MSSFNQSANSDQNEFQIEKIVASGEYLNRSSENWPTAFVPAFVSSIPLIPPNNFGFYLVSQNVPTMPISPLEKSRNFYRSISKRHDIGAFKLVSLVYHGSEFPWSYSIVLLRSTRKLAAPEASKTFKIFTSFVSNALTREFSSRIQNLTQLTLVWCSRGLQNATTNGFARKKCATIHNFLLMGTSDSTFGKVN